MTLHLLDVQNAGLSPYYVVDGRRSTEKGVVKRQRRRRVVMILIKFKSRQSVVAFPLCVFLFLMVDAIKRSGVCWVLYLGPSGFSQLAPIKPHPGIFQGQSKYHPWSRDLVRLYKYSWKWLLGDIPAVETHPWPQNCKIPPKFLQWKCVWC